MPRSRAIIRSSFECRTSVGTQRPASRSVTSTSSRSRRAATALTADVDIRNSSSTQRFWSSLAEGIRLLVNTRRNVLSGRSHPTLIICRKVR